MIVRDAVVKAIVEVLPGVSAAEVADELTLGDLGADSVDRVEIITTVIDSLGCERRLSEFAEIPNIGAMIAFLSEVTEL